MLRKPVVSGRFYPSDPKELEKDLTGYLGESSQEKFDAKGVLSPHAGYMYSGLTAGALFSSINIPETVIVIGPNHTGVGDTGSIMSEGGWELPFGTVPLCSSLATLIKERSKYITESKEGHAHEHSVEVQVPFLQFLKKTDLQIVPITIMDMSYDQCVNVGNGIASAIKEFDRPVLIVASSDMNHYESADVGGKKDKMAIERILTLDSEGLYSTVKQNRISMCGVLPAVIMLTANIADGAENATLVQYTHSGMVNGDNEKVVGYAGIRVN